MKIHPRDKFIVDDINPSMEHGPWIAGGAVLKWSKGQNVDRGDIDVFCKDHFQQKVVTKYLTSMNKYTTSFTSDNAITFSVGEGPQKVQVIKCAYFESPLDVIDNFDLTLCQFITDGIDTLTGKRTVGDVNGKLINVHKLNRNSIIKRIMKYANYGYSLTDETIEILEKNADEIKWEYDMTSFDGSCEYDNAF